MSHRIGLPFIVVAICAVLQSSGALDEVNHRLTDARQSLISIPASQQIVIVAIDPKSLRQIGEWPWSRAIHADILRSAAHANAATVFFDIDFAFPSDPAGDQAFVDALADVGGGTLLPVFRQTGPSGEWIYNLPHAPFRQHSWPAFVNVVPSENGQIRTYPYSGVIDGQLELSVAAMLAGGLARKGEEFAINFAIQPTDIPTFSAVDLLNGHIPHALLEGRSIIVGATAIELGDHFAVPVHQILPGAVLHALASETLLQDVAITQAQWHGLILPLVCVLMLFQAIKRGRPWRLVSALFLASLAVEVLSLAVFRQTLISLPTGLVHPAFVMLGIGRLSTQLRRTNLLVRQKEVEADNNEALVMHLFDNSSDGYVVLDETGSVLLQSEAARDMLGGQGSAVVLPDALLAAVNAATSAIGGAEIKPNLQTLEIKTDRGDAVLECLTVATQFLEFDTTTRQTTAKPLATVTLRDVTELKKHERRIAYLSRHDDRTNALLRQPFVKRIGSMLQSGSGFLICVLKIDRLKTINRTMGRAIGDAVVAEVAQRIGNSGIVASDIARLDGTIFGFLVKLPVNSDQIDRNLDALLKEISQPYILDNGSARIAAQLGYAVVEPSESPRAELALQMAEDALDEVKFAGARNIGRYAPGTAERRARARLLEREMIDALERGEFYLLYQPQHRLPDRALIGYEALIRWNSRAFGVVRPDEFIPIAESTGFIIDLGQFALSETLKAAKMLPGHLTVSPNVSAQQLLDDGFEASVAHLLDVFDVSPTRLNLELTESEEISSSAIDVMRRIAATGVTWALDDFGTGFSSLAYLPTLPLNKVKLDRAFLRDIPQDPAALQTVTSIAELAHSYGFEILCEGVETADVVETLAKANVDTVQGYFFGRPQTLFEESA